MSSFSTIFLNLLLLFSVLRTSFTLMCYSCDGELSCNQPELIKCTKKYEECFVVAKGYSSKGNGLRKGCTATCDHSNIAGNLCRTCDTDYCNGKKGLGVPFERPEKAHSRRPIGPRKTTATVYYSAFDLISKVAIFVPIHFLLLFALS
ncbi:hypothetical protein AB6A40_006954 [Gnathostoma spinigerum]|uniref:Uncharacterized protein n=1 Tax=Gnathostoma spinigerum TaxID=75299 RepID=A0ABD6EL23_9BILA